MKRPTMLLERTLIDFGLQLRIAITRDVQLLERRYKDEGLSFLTITLPSLDDVLLHGLSFGRIVPSDFPSFRRASRRESFPAFMRGFFMRIFDRDGWLLPVPCIDSIRAIRQVTRLFKKVKSPCSAARQRRAFERYQENDQSISWNDNRSSVDTMLLHDVAGYLWSDLEDLSGELYCFPGIFGTGATAERRKFNERHSVSVWPRRSESSFPADFHAQHTLDAGLDGVVFLNDEEESPVRVVQVPKTLKTPRTISVEPSYMMLMQQSIAKPLMAYLESNRFPYASIRFTDQSVNSRLARDGSRDGSLSTIDLSDASDLVALDLVKEVFEVCPTFLDYILDCRSTRARMPDGSILQLKKFASMGSALCFPIEAMIFFTIVTYSMVRQSGKRLSRNLLSELSARVSVYGDDIIVPTEMATGVMNDLEAFGLKVNHEKSFTSGYFRESCGGDFYKGHDVTPVYCRLFDDTGTLRDTGSLVSYVSMSNQFYMKGNWHVSQYIRDYIQSKKRRVPRTVSDAGILSYVSVAFTTDVRWDVRRTGYTIRGPVLLTKRQADSMDDVRGNMLRSFQQRYHSDSLSSFRAKCGKPHRSRLRDESPAECDLKYRGFGQPKDWFNYDYILKESNLDHLKISFESDLTTSVRPYTLYHKYRWTPLFEHRGLAW
nr:MAG: hypothetical protein 3 [Leviviridae sp.]